MPIVYNTCVIVLFIRMYTSATCAMHSKTHVKQHYSKPHPTIRYTMYIICVYVVEALVVDLNGFLASSATNIRLHLVSTMAP